MKTRVTVPVRVDTGTDHSPVWLLNMQLEKHSHKIRDWLGGEQHSMYLTMILQTALLATQCALQFFNFNCNSHNPFV